MTSPIKATEALDAQREAAEAEGIFEPTADEMKLLKRRKALKERIAKAEAEVDAIEGTIFSGMKERGASALNVNGRNVALISKVKQTKFDMKSFKAAYAALALQFTTSDIGERKAIKF